MSQRTSFRSTPSSSSSLPLPATSRYTNSTSPSSTTYAANRSAEDLEGQNESHLQGLSAKVRMLKEITSSIGAEVRDSTKLLSGMNDDFSETSGILGGTMRRMGKMAKRQGGQWCYWMAFLLLVSIVFFWTWVYRR